MSSVCRTSWLFAGLPSSAKSPYQYSVETKATERLLPVHEAQLLTYLKLSGHSLGILINFNVVRIKDGLRRIVLST